MMTENEIAKIIVDAAIEVHRELGGPGLLEDVYEESLAEELRLRGLKVEHLPTEQTTHRLPDVKQATETLDLTSIPVR